MVMKMEPYYNYNDSIIIYNGDMLEVVPSLNRRFSHCITDPPYGVQRDNNFSTMGRQGCTFGDWDERDDVMSMLPQWIECMCGVTDENIVIFNDWHNMGLIAQCLVQNGFDDKELVLWRKTNPMPRNTDRRFVPCLEYALWATRRDCRWTFNRTPGRPYEIPVIDCMTERKEDYNDHTTSKPLQLMERLVALFTDKGDWLLDPFGGSGTIAIACHRMSRRIVLVEKDEHYCEVIARRVSDATSQLYLF